MIHQHPRTIDCPECGDVVHVETLTARYTWCRTCAHSVPLGSAVYTACPLCTT